METSRVQVTANTLSLDEVSHWSAKARVYDLIVAGEEFIVLDVFYNGHKLVVINIEKASFFWKDPFNIRSIDVNQRTAYIGKINDVLSYDLETGRKLWEYKGSSKEHGSIYVTVEGDKLIVYNESSHSRFISNILTLDAQTGKLLNTDNNPETYIPPDNKLIYRTATVGEVTYQFDTTGRLTSIDNRTGQEIGYLEMLDPSNHDKVAASNEYLIIYHDNQREILVFRRKN
jgi:outer membrane protein assembly factor BamB